MCKKWQDSLILASGKMRFPTNAGKPAAIREIFPDVICVIPRTLREEACRQKTLNRLIEAERKTIQADLVARWTSFRKVAYVGKTLDTNFISIIY